MSDLLTLHQAAERLNTAEATLRYWRYQGSGPASFKVGRRVMYRAADVERWVSEQEQAQRGRAIA